MSAIETRPATSNSEAMLRRVQAESDELRQMVLRQSQDDYARTLVLQVWSLILGMGALIAVGIDRFDWLGAFAEYLFPASFIVALSAAAMMLITLLLQMSVSSENSRDRKALHDVKCKISELTEQLGE